MIRLRTASALVVGTVAALAVGGTALAAASSPTPSAPSAAATAPGEVDAVGMEAARAIAIKAAGGGQVTDIERETEEGRGVWDVEVLLGAAEHEMDVDRASGAVLRHETEQDNEGNGQDDD